MAKSPTTADNLAGGSAAKPGESTTKPAAGTGSMDAAAAAARSSTQSPVNPDPASTTDNSISDDSTQTQSAVVGISGGVGREQVVQGVLNRSYQAGVNAPQGSFNGNVYRGVPTAHENTALAYEHSKVGRYHAPGQHAVYAAPTQSGAIRELSIYPSTENRTYTQLDASITPDPATGKGGIADIRAGMRQQNLPESVLTQPTTGAHGSSALHSITGEHRYSAPQQAGKGAIDAGAAAIRAPAAVGDTQVDVLPANASPSTLTPVARQTLSPSGVLGPVRSAGSVEPMPAYRSSVTPGMLDMPAGTASRASSARYGALGAAGDTLVQAGVSAWNGEAVNASQLGQDLAVNTSVGAIAARTTDALAPRLGSLKAGGAVGGAIQASVSGYTNYQQYSAGEISGERAIANTVVDTGTAVAAGATGAAVGAVAGSFVPVAGTAVGAVVGFGVGVGAHYAIQAVDSVTGFTTSAKESLTGALESAGNWISSWW